MPRPCTLRGIIANIQEIKDIIEPQEAPMWNLFMDGSPRKVSFGVGVVIGLTPRDISLNVVRYGLRLQTMQLNTRYYWPT